MDLKNLINQSKLDQYAAYLKSTNLSDASIKRKVSSLSSFQKFLVKKKLIEETSQISTPIETNIVDNKKTEAKHFFDFSFLKKGTFDTNKSFKDIWSNSFSRYSVIVLLVLLLSGLGYGIYSQTILKANKNLAFSTASAPVRTGRFLSFQGRLTDSSGNPITSSTAIVFKLYNTQAVGTGTSLYTSSTGNSQTVVPDENGIFSVTIGQSHGTEIPASVFSENANVFLEITAGGETMSPRQPIATVAYALNSETLQGLPPSASGLKDTVMVIDSLGNINLGETSPSIVSTSGTMGIQGQALLLDATNSLANSNIRIDPTSSNGAIQLNTNGTGSSNAITASNSNLSTGNLFYGQIGNDNRGYNFLNFKNFDVGTSALTTRFYINGYGDTYVGRDLTVSNNAGVGGTLTLGNLNIGSSFLVSNLNADLIDGLHANGLPYVLNASNTTLTRSGVGSSASPYTLALNLGSTNTWTADTYFVGGKVGIGTTAPKSALDVSVYGPGDYESGSNVFSPTVAIGSTGTIQTWIVPHTGTYTLKAYGAEGGQGSSSTPGKGAYIQGDFVLSVGDTIKVLVGQKGQPHGVKGYGAGGGGGTFIVKNNSTLLLVAGGGGGSSTYNTRDGINASIGTSGTSGNSGYSGGTSGNGGGGSNGNWGGQGGGGYSGNGGSGFQNISNAQSFLNGGKGGIGYGGDGGFGGGGASGGGAGGGGGYSGGGAGYDYNAGGGGGSYNSGLFQVNNSGVQTGPGLASAEWQGVAKRAANFDGSVGIGIGATDPNYKIQVQGQSYLNGNVGIGTAPDNNYALNVNGKTHITKDLVVDGSVSFNGNLSIGSSLTVDSLTAKNVTSENLNINGLANLGRQSLSNGSNNNTGSNPVYIFTNDFQSMSNYNNGGPGGDVVTVNQGSDNVSIFINNNNGSWGPKVDVPTGSSPVYGFNFDFNQDYAADFMTVNSGSTSVSVFTNMQIGSSIAFNRNDYAVGSNPVYAVTNNFDNDSYGYYSDLAVANSGSNNVSILPNNGSTYNAATNISVGSNPNFITSGDFNNDGNYGDLVVTNNGDNFISILTNDNQSDTVSFTRTDITTGYGPTHAAIADVNKDNKSDIIVANNGENTISVLTNTGSGGSVSYSKEDYYTGGGVKFVLATDLNNDSYPDIVTANEWDNTISVFLNKKDGTFFPAVNYNSGGSYPQSIIVQNLNSDNTWNDLIVVNSGSDSFYDPGNISVFKNKEDGTFKNPLSYSTPNSTGAKNIANTTYDFYDGYNDYYYNFLLVANANSNTYTSFANLSNNYGSNAFAVDAKGNIGIGTNAPKSKLQVVGGDVLFGANATVKDSALTDLGVEGNLNVGGSLSVNALTTFNLNNTGAFYNDGRVGIGTHSPVARLHVKAGFSPLKDLNTQTTGSGNSDYSMGYAFTPTQNGTITQLGARGTNNSNKRITLYDMGTGTSLASTHIITTGVENWVFTDINPINVTANTTYSVVSRSADYSFSYGYLPAAPITVNGVTILNGLLGYQVDYPTQTSGTTMYGQADVTFIENAAVFEGNVGIGTTNPTHKFEVVGDALITSLNVGTTLITNNLFALGSVGIGNTSPNYMLDVTGDALISTRLGIGETNLAYALNVGGTGGLGVGGTAYFASYVGIGTTAPNYMLEVNGEGVFTKLGIGGTSSIYNLLVSSNGIGITGDSTFTNNVTIGGTFVSVGSTNIVTNLNADLFDGYHLTNLPFVNDATNNTLTRSGLGPYTLGINLGATNTWTAPTTFSNSLNVGGTAYFASYVGIGTTAPTQKLEVNGSVKVSNSLYLGSNNSDYLYLWPDSSGSYLSHVVGSSNTGIQLVTKTNASIALMPNGTGNVGIGTTAPTAKLTVVGTAGGTIFNAISSAGSNLFSIDNGTGNVSFQANGGETQIGGGSGARLSVSSLTTSKVAASISGVSGQTADLLQVNTVGNLNGNALVIKANGSVGIGTTNPNYKLEVTGDASISTNLSVGGTLTLSQGAQANYILQSIDGTGKAKWVSPTGIGGYTASNGLNLVGVDVRLGGLLTQNTDIGLSGFSLTFSDAGSTLVSFSNSSNTFYNPTNFASSGDVSMAYDLNFTNSTGSNINTAGPLSIKAGEVFNSSNLTLQTYNAGKIILSSSNLWNDGINFGIGTTNPLYKFQVNGEGVFTKLGIGATNSSYEFNVVGAGNFTTNLNVGSTLYGNIINSSSLTANQLVRTDGSKNLTSTAGTVNQLLHGDLSWGDVLLGTQTSGNYVNALTAGVGISISGTAGEGWSPTITNAGILDATNTTLTRSGSIGSYTLGLNLGNTNTWTGAQTFNANTYFPGSGIWNTAGAIGIGTTSPAGKLQVNGGDINISYNNNWNNAQARNSDKISVLASLKGRQINTNPDFMKGLSGYSVYDNAGSGQVAISLIGDTTSPNASNQILQIVVSNGATSPSPGLGGFYTNTGLCSGTAVGNCIRLGNRIIERVWAKIPVGYTMAWTTNSLGTGGNQQWISGTAGTGNWEEYIVSITLGPGAGTTNYFYINGASRPVTWYVAQVDMIDTDQVADVDRATSLNVGYQANVNLGTGQMLTTSSSYFATTGGAVGIGTTSPLGKLQVNGGDIFFGTTTFGVGQSSVLTDLRLDGNLSVGGTIFGDGSGLTNVTASQISFDKITTGTNLTALMTVGSGSSLSYTGTGVINASQLQGATWASPLAIGTGVSNAANFSTLNVGTSSIFNGNVTIGTTGLLLNPSARLNVNIGNRLVGTSGLDANQTNFAIIGGNINDTNYTLDNTYVNTYTRLGVVGIGHNTTMNSQAAIGVLGIGNAGYNSAIGGRFIGTAYGDGTYPVSAYGIKTGAVSITGKNGYGVYIDSGSGPGTNWGLYQSGVNDENYFAGSVGIGTTNPITQLEVSKTVAGEFQALTLRNSNGALNDKVSLIFQNTSATGSYRGSYITSERVNANAANDLYFSTSADASNPTEKLRITGAGNIGIGTTAPLSGLDVNNLGSGAPTPLASVPSYGLILGNSNTNAIIQLGVNGGNATWMQGRMRAAGGSLALSLNPLGGNVGVGTTSPLFKLTVDSTVDDTIPALGAVGGKFALLNNAGKYGLISGVLGSGNAFMQSQRVDGTATAYNLLLQPSGGNVGIGNTAPQRGLEITKSLAGEVQLRLGNSSTAFWDLGRDGTDGYFNIKDQSGVKRLVINSANGNVGIGTTNPNYKLEVTGDASISTNLSVGGTLTLSQGAQANYILQSIDGTGKAKWVSPTGIGGYTASNGLNLVGVDVRLGGLLTQNTDIGLSGFSLTFSDAGSTLVSFSNSSNTFYNPTNFASSGDVSMAYDLNFTNSTASYIRSQAPLYIQTESPYANLDLNLTAANAGQIYLNSDAQLTKNLTVGGTFISVGSTNLVTNLNSDLFDGYNVANFPFVNNTTNTTLTRTGSGPYTLGINLGATNTWTAPTTFSSSLSVGGTLNLSTIPSIADNNLVLTSNSGIVSSINTTAWDKNAADDYQSWNLLTNGIGSTAINSGASVNFVAGAGISLAQNGSTVTIINNGIGTTYDGNNGITKTIDNYFQLGGKLNQNTEIGTSSFGLSFVGSDNSQSLYIAANSSIGIGMTNPLAKLEVKGIQSNYPCADPTGLGSSATYPTYINSPTDNGTGISYSGGYFIYDTFDVYVHAYETLPNTSRVYSPSSYNNLSDYSGNYFQLDLNWNPTATAQGYYVGVFDSNAGTLYSKDVGNTNSIIIDGNWTGWTPGYDPTPGSIPAGNLYSEKIWNLWGYKTTNGTKVYSVNPANVYDYGSYDGWKTTLSWDNTGADGYILQNPWDGYYIDVGSSLSYVDDGNFVGWTYGSPTVTPIAGNIYQDLFHAYNDNHSLTIDGLGNIVTDGNITLKNASIIDGNATTLSVGTSSLNVSNILTAIQGSKRVVVGQGDNYPTSSVGTQLVFGDYQTSGTPGPEFIFNGVSNWMGLGQATSSSGNVLRLGAVNGPGSSWSSMGSYAFKLIIDGDLDVNNITVGDNKNIAFSTSTGTKIGTATNQKLSFWNATPIIQPVNTTAIDTLLTNTGLRASGGVANFANRIIGANGVGVTGNLTVGGTFVSVGSTNMVANLNSDLWDGYQFANYLDQAVKTTSSPLFAGLTISAGGIGVSGNSTFSKNLTIGGTLSLTNTNLNVGVSTALFIDSSNNVYKRNLGDLAFQNAVSIGWVANASSPQTIGIGVTLSLTGTNGLTTTSVGTSQITFGLGGTLTSNTKINTSTYDLSFLGLGGTQALYINSSGDVGIGTTVPISKLNVAADASAESLLQLSITSKDTNKRLRIGYNTTGNYAAIQALTYGSSYDNLALNTLGGNVGIGTSSPLYKLDINGNLRVGSTAYFASWASFGSVTAPSNPVSIYADGTGNYAADGNVGQLVIHGSSDSTKALGFLMDTTNNVGKIQVQKIGTGTYNLALQAMGGLVGIGTASPNYKLEVSGDALISTRLGVGSTNTLYALNVGGTGGLGVGGTASFGSLVGIGTSSPRENLHIYAASSATQSIQDANSVLRFVATGGMNYIQSGSSLTSDSKADLQFTAIYGTSPWMTIKGASGNIGIGTTTPNYKLEVVGSAFVSTNFGVGATNTNYSIYTNGKLGVGSTAYFASLVGIGISNPTQALTIGVGTSINITGNANGDLSAKKFIDIDNNAYKLILANVTPEKNSLGLTSTGSIKFNVGDTNLSNMIYINNGAASRIQNFNNGLLLAVGTGNTTAGQVITGWNNQLFLSSNGSIGVGTTAPNALYKMDIGGTLNVQDIFQNGQQITMGNWNLNGTNIYNTNLGSVGIGTSNFSGTFYKLRIVGDVSLSGMLNMNNNYITNDYQPGDSNFLGNYAGYSATYASNSNFFGNNAGYIATSANDSNFLGNYAGYLASSANGSNFFGLNAGYAATSAYHSNFFGSDAGHGADNAYNSNFLGLNAGYYATNAHDSNFFGNNAGLGATNASNSIFIGSYAGYNDNVNNTSTNTSIAIGRYSGTGTYSNSVAIGHGVINSAASQMNLGNVLYLSGIYGSDTQSSTALTNGRVGIGGTNSNYNFNVVGNANLTTNLNVGNTITTANLYASNYVGIGTTKPRYELEIKNGSLYVSSTNVGSSIIASESFTSTTFVPTNFTTGATSPSGVGGSAFVRDTSTFYDTNASAGSNVGTTTSSTAWMETTVNMPSAGDLTFQWKVSSEPTYDYLFVCIDNSGCTRSSGFTQRISGTVDWTPVVIPITSGSHTVRWAYGKDGSADTGSDRGWVDNIKFITYGGGNIYTDGYIGIGTTKPIAPLNVVAPNVSVPIYTDKNVTFSPTNTGQTGSTQVWTAPSTGNYTIDAYGAAGGYATDYTSYPGLGARIKGTVTLNIGETLIILVGQKGLDARYGGGGGGGTFVVKLSGTQPVIVAGGGGGARQADNNPTVSNASTTITAPNNPTNNNATGGGGGGGFLTNGLGASSYNNYGRSFVNGGAGGINSNAYAGAGGYGGGGGGEWTQWGSSGGGGGYSGGGGGTNGGGGNAGYYDMAGGASYNGGSNQVNTAGANTSAGSVTITYQEISFNATGKETAALFEGKVGIGSTSSTNTLNASLQVDGQLTKLCYKTVTFNPTNTGSIGSSQVWIAPVGTTATITAVGAAGGGTYNYNGGNGSSITGNFALSAGDVISVMVGQKGAGTTEYNSSFSGGGGGGGTFIKINTSLILGAGGGGGAGGYHYNNGYGYGTYEGGGYYSGVGRTQFEYSGWGGNGFYTSNGTDGYGGGGGSYGGYTGGAGGWGGGTGGGGGGYCGSGGAGGGLWGGDGAYTGGCGQASGIAYTGPTQYPGGTPAGGSGSYGGGGGGGTSYPGGTNQVNIAANNPNSGQATITYSYLCPNNSAIFNGNVGINNTNPQYALDVISIGTSEVARFRNENSASSCSFTASGTLVCSSDSRLKKNIDDLNYGLNTLSQLRAVDFNWNTDSNGTSKSLGFIAQEVEKLLPELVTTDSDGYKQLNTIGMVPIIVKSVQEQQAEILALSQDLNITQTGQINVNMNISDDVLKTLGYSDIKNEIQAADYNIVDSLGNQVNRIAQFSQIAVAKIQTGLLSATNVITKNMVTENLVSPKANIDELTALNIQSTQITTTDLKAETATVSSLYADNIITKQGSITDVMAQKIADLRDELKQFVASAGTTQADTPLMAQASDWDTSVASGSAKLAGDLTLSGDMVIGSKLTVNGDTQLGNAFITGTLSTGQIAIKDNFIETTNSALYLQPSATGSVHILGDTLIVADTGDVIINGNLNLNGTLTAQNASINGSLIANMIQAETASFDSLSTNQIKIATDSAQVIIAESGFAALATSSAELTSNATAGTVNLPIGKTELIISNNKLTPNSMVYLTPNGSTQNQVVYVKQKTIDSFTIAIDQPLDNDVSINWWIIN